VCFIPDSRSAVTDSSCDTQVKPCDAIESSWSWYTGYLYTCSGAAYFERNLSRGRVDSYEIGPVSFCYVFEEDCVNYLRFISPGMLCCVVFKQFIPVASQINIYSLITPSKQNELHKRLLVLFYHHQADHTLRISKKISEKVMTDVLHAKYPLFLSYFN
jgi:hypothetical protein